MFRENEVPMMVPGNKEEEAKTNQEKAAKAGETDNGSNHGDSVEVIFP
jgi:hypothetical protein